MQNSLFNSNVLTLGQKGLVWLPQYQQHPFVFPATAKQVLEECRILDERIEINLIRVNKDTKPGRAKENQTNWRNLVDGPDRLFRVNKALIEEMRTNRNSIETSD